MLQPAYLNITDDLSLREFEAIIDYVLTHGDRKTYCNRYCDNPHLKVGDFDIFLSPTDEQNTFCDTSISGFNEIVIYHPRADIQYYHIKLADAEEVDQYLKTSGNKLESNLDIKSYYFCQKVSFRTPSRTIAFRAHLRKAQRR